MKKDYLEFDYNGKNTRINLNNNQHKTNMICPYDFVPIIFEKGSKFEVYECPGCNTRYENVKEIFDAVKEELDNSMVKTNRLEKVLKKVQSEMKQKEIEF